MTDIGPETDSRTGRARGPDRAEWWRIYRRWVVAVLIGETAGFAVAAVVGIATGGSPWTYPLLVLAGCAEGACLGTAQALAFRGSRLPVPFAAWVAATAAGAALAWAIGLLPSSLPPLNWTDPLVVASAAIGAAALLLAIPVLQAVVLRRDGLPAAGWIGMNVLAWTVGILWTFAPSPFIDERTPVGALVAVYVVAGLLMALTVAVITGLWVARTASARPFSTGHPIGVIRIPNADPGHRAAAVSSGSDEVRRSPDEGS